MKNLLLFTIAPLIAFSTLAQPENKIDSLLAIYQDQPGCAVGVFKNDEVIYQKGVGIANLDYAVEITPETVFDIGSVSKQFTAACILLLEEDGKLSQTENAGKYIPEIELFKTKGITIKHLLNHTSGLRDYLLLHMLAGNSFNEEFSEQDGIDILQRQQNLNFKPGEKFEYSNSNYMVLAVIIRRVTGISIGEFAKERIFKPLDMQQTLILEDAGLSIKNRAIGYQKTPDGLRISHHYYFTIGGDGQVYTNLPDFYKWHKNFTSKTIGSNAFNTSLLKKGELNNGEKIDYACGIIHGDYKGRNTIKHTGSWGGSRAIYLSFPEDDLAIVIFSNFSEFDLDLAYKIADLYLSPDTFDIDQPGKKVMELNPAMLKRYTGEYNMQEGVSLKVSVSNDSLFIYQGWDHKKYQIIPVGIHEFVANEQTDLYFVFQDFENGRPSTIQSSFQGNTISFKKPSHNAVWPSEPNEFEGKYYSTELDCSYLFYVNETNLMVKVKNNPPIRLHQTGNVQFEGFGMQFIFSMKDNLVSRCTLTAGPVFGIDMLKYKEIEFN